MHFQFSRKCTFVIESNTRKIVVIVFIFCFQTFTMLGQLDILKDVIKEADKSLNQPLLKMTAISDEEENKIGSDTQNKILKDYKLGKTGKFQISEIFKRIKSITSRTKIKYEFKILESDDFNAFAIAGGKTFIFTKLIKELDNQDELAFLIAHEIAHNELKHCIKKIQYYVTTQKINPLLANVVQIAYNVYSTPFSQDQEYAADDLGVKLMIKAGFKKDGAISFFSKLAKIEQKYKVDKRDALNDFISSHPTADKRKERIKNIK